MQDLRWAVMGTGRIAAGVSPRLREATGCAFAGAASRDLTRAEAFVTALGIPGVRPMTYEDLERAADIEAVYLTLPNHLHAEWCRRLMESGKHVLCEKPLVAREREARELAETSRRTGRLCVEGFMYLHHPMADRLLEIGRSGSDPANPIGPLREVRITRYAMQTDDHILATRLSHAMQGGVLMDLGCYAVSIARLVTGEEPDPRTIQGSAELAPPVGTETERVDETCAFSWSTPKSVRISAECSFKRPPKVLIELVGERGTASAGYPFLPRAEREEIAIESGGLKYDEVIRDGGDPFTNQFERFARAARGEAEVLPSIEWSVGQARVIETLLDKIGVRFSD